MRRHDHLVRPVCDAMGSRPLRLADIGARDGLPARWAPYRRIVQVVAFEPDAVEADRLRSATPVGGHATSVLAAAAWEATGTASLHLTHSRGCSSMLVPAHDELARFPDAARFAVERTVEVPTTTVDDAADTLGLSIDFLKIDVQGAALPVLRGATRTLERVSGVEVEAELQPMYEGESLFGDVHAALLDAGLELLDLRPTYWRPADTAQMAGTKGQLVFADALYLPRVDRVAVDDEALLRAIAVAAAYGLRDRVASLSSRADGRFDAIGAAAAAPTFASRIGRFRYRTLLGHLAKDIGDALLTGPDSWALAEQALGGQPRVDRLPRLR